MGADNHGARVERLRRSRRRRVADESSRCCSSSLPALPREAITARRRRGRAFGQRRGVAVHRSAGWATAIGVREEAAATLAVPGDVGSVTCAIFWRHCAAKRDRENSGVITAAPFRRR